MIGTLYVPSFLGDVNLTATGEKSCKLVAEKLTSVERAALERLTAPAIKKGWCAAGTSLAGLGSYDLAAPLAKVGKLLGKALKPGRKLVTAVRFHDGRLEELSEAECKARLATVETDDKPAVAVTVAKPTRGCPPPDFPAADVAATRVLTAFLDDAQRADFARYQRFIVVGADTGRRYMVTSRHCRDGLAQYQRQLYDLDARMPLCVHEDAAVPAAEELLALRVWLGLAGRETELRGLDDYAALA